MKITGLKVVQSPYSASILGPQSQHSSSSDITQSKLLRTKIAATDYPETKETLYKQNTRPIL